MFGNLRWWREKRLGNRTNRRLYPILIRRYGKDECYTLGQIDRVLELSGLGQRYRPYAYAIFTKPSEFQKLDPDLKMRVLALNRHDGTSAKGSYPLSMLPTSFQAGHGIDIGGFCADGGGNDAGCEGGGDA